MTKIILSDFSRVVLFPKDLNYNGSLNKLHDLNVNNPDYNFWDYYSINTELIEKYIELKNKFSILCFTTGHIQEYYELKNSLNNVFKRTFTVEELSLKKDIPEAYTKIASILQVRPEEVLFIDDTMENLDAASKVGFQTFHYENNEDLFKHLRELPS